MASQRYILQSCLLGMFNYKWEMVLRALLIQRYEPLVESMSFNCFTYTAPFALTDYSGMKTTGTSNSSPGRLHAEIRPFQLK